MHPIKHKEEEVITRKEFSYLSNSLTQVFKQMAILTVKWAVVHKFNNNQILYTNNNINNTKIFQQISKIYLTAMWNKQVKLIKKIILLIAIFQGHILQWLIIRYALA